jgi:hypothetical protein
MVSMNQIQEVEVGAALLHECPQCGQLPHQSCITAGGNRADKPHDVRLRAAARSRTPVIRVAPAVTAVAAAERRATMIYCWAPTVVPLLMQTGDYTMALLSGPLGQPTPEAVAAYREVHEERKARARGGVPVQAVIGEAALRSVVGGPEVMRGQIGQLLALPERFTVRVLPFTEPAQGRAAFMARDLERPVERLVFVEGYREGFESVPEVVEGHLERFQYLSRRSLDADESRGFLQSLLDDVSAWG